MAQLTTYKATPAQIITLAEGLSKMAEYLVEATPDMNHTRPPAAINALDAAANRIDPAYLEQRKLKKKRNPKLLDITAGDLEAIKIAAEGAKTYLAELPNQEMVRSVSDAHLKDLNEGTAEINVDPIGTDDYFQDFMYSAIIGTLNQIRQQPDKHKELCSHIDLAHELAEKIARDTPDRIEVEITNKIRRAYWNTNRSANRYHWEPFAISSPKQSDQYFGKCSDKIGKALSYLEEKTETAEDKDIKMLKRLLKKSKALADELNPQSIKR